MYVDVKVWLERISIQMDWMLSVERLKRTKTHIFIQIQMPTNQHIVNW